MVAHIIEKLISSVESSQVPDHLIVGVRGAGRIESLPVKASAAGVLDRGTLMAYDESVSAYKPATAAGKVLAILADRVEFSDDFANEYANVACYLDGDFNQEKVKLSWLSEDADAATRAAAIESIRPAARACKIILKPVCGQYKQS